MARIDLPEGPGEDRARIWQLHPEFGAAAEHYNEVVQRCSILPVREHEAARIRIAHINGCEPCSAARMSNAGELGLDESFYEDVDDPAKRGRYTPREVLAIEFAERFAVGRDAFDDAWWQRARAAFSDAEIVDLTVSVASGWRWAG